MMMFTTQCRDLENAEHHERSQSLLDHAVRIAGCLLKVQRTYVVVPPSNGKTVTTATGGYAKTQAVVAGVAFHEQAQMVHGIFGRLNHH